MRLRTHYIGARSKTIGGLSGGGVTVAAEVRFLDTHSVEAARLSFSLLQCLSPCPADASGDPALHKQQIP